MIFLDWNMGWGASIEKATAGIKNIIGAGSFIVTLQEIGKTKSKVLVENFGETANIKYSLDFRPRGKREPKSRDLGIMIITSKDIEVIEAQVLVNTLLPERTLYVKVRKNGKEVKIISLHSITGCDHKKAKSLQFYAFAGAIDQYEPDIVSFDANEPEVDAEKVSDMKFFDNKDGGKGAREFFTSLGDNGLSDSFLHSIEKENHVKRQPLAISHIVHNKGPVRYDFIFLKEKVIQVKNVEYRMQEAQEASGDHAFVIMDFEMK